MATAESAGDGDVRASVPLEMAAAGAGTGSEGKWGASRSWILLNAAREDQVLDADKYAIMRRVDINARDLRILDPLLSYPSARWRCCCCWSIVMGVGRRALGGAIPSSSSMPQVFLLAGKAASFGTRMLSVSCRNARTGCCTCTEGRKLGIWMRWLAVVGGDKQMLRTDPLPLAGVTVMKGQ